MIASHDKLLKNMFWFYKLRKKIHLQHLPPIFLNNFYNFGVRAFLGYHVLWNSPSYRNFNSFCGYLMQIGAQICLLLFLMVIIVIVQISWPLTRFMWWQCILICMSNALLSSGIKYMLTLTKKAMELLSEAIYIRKIPLLQILGCICHFVIYLPADM